VLAALAACSRGPGTTAAPPAGGAWTAIEPSPLGADVLASAVWTGRSVIHFNGQQGAAFDPAAGRWARIADAPEPADETGAVWAGTQLAVKAKNGGPLLLYDPAADRWRRSSPWPFVEGPLVWTGDLLAVWGRRAEEPDRCVPGSCTTYTSDGAFYDPARDRWAPIPRPALRPRVAAAVVWAADRLVVWGGYDATEASRPELFGDGAVYDPAAGAWARMAPSPVKPTAFTFFDSAGAVSTGDRMLVAPGATYDPVANRWTKTARPPFEPGSLAVWTGARLYALAGDQGAALAYDPAADRWSRVPGRLVAAAAWTGEEIIAVAPEPARYRP